MKSFLHITRFQYVQLWFLLVALTGYIVEERTQAFNDTSFYLCLGLVVLATFAYFKAKKKTNYFDFDTLFIITSLMIGFLASLFYHAPYYKLLFFFDFNYKYINSGSWLFTIGMICFYFGSLSIPFVSNIRIIKDSSYLKYRYDCKLVFILLIIFIFLFIVTGGLRYYKSIYEGETGNIGLASHFSMIIITLSLIIISCEFANKLNDHNHKLKLQYFIPIIIFAILIMICGNRTVGLQLFLPLIGLYTFFLKPFNLKYLAIALIPAFIGMYIIQVTRQNQEVTMELQSPVLMARDLTIPYRATFVAMDYVDNNSYSYGITMSGPLIGIIPSLSRILSVNLRDVSSAEALTDYTYYTENLPQKNKIGLGSNIIADIYLSFGLIGIIFLMCFFGYFVQYAEKRSRKGNIYWIIVLSGLLANCVFVARSSFTYPVRYIIWGVVFFYIFKSLKIIKVIRHNSNNI